MTTEVSGATVPQTPEPSTSPVELRLPVRGMTCEACVHRVRAALESVPGVGDVRVELASGLASVKLDPTRATATLLKDAVESAGYEPGDPVPAPPQISGDQAQRSAPEATAGPARLTPAAFGLGASLLLLGFYLGIVGLAQGFEHATELLLADWYLVIPIVLGFGVQVGLFLHVRSRRLRQGTGSATTLAGAGTGTSSLAMVACCAHHLTDVLPLIGLSGATLLLSEYRQPLMLLGIATNVVGVGIMVRMLRRASC